MESKLHYRPELDGLRAVCIIFTMFNHLQNKVPAWINGSVGVDIFFALSGFLITTLLIKESKNTGTISFRSFYIRRLFRIVPLYVLAFMATAIAAVVLARLGGDIEKLQYLNASWPWILSFNRELCPSEICGPTFFGHAWTIGIEEKFYIFWPLIFFLTIANIRKGFLESGLLISAVGCAILFSSSLARGYAGLMFGCISALWYSRKERELLKDIYWLLVIFIGYIASTFEGIKGYGNIAISFGASWLILSIYHKPAGVISKILSWRLLAWAGKLTYGIYLFHVLIIGAVHMFFYKISSENILRNWVVEAIICYVVAVVFAAALYVTIEKPMIRAGRGLAARYW